MADKTFELEWLRYASDDLFTARHLFESRFIIYRFCLRERISGGYLICRL